VAASVPAQVTCIASSSGRFRRSSRKRDTKMIETLMPFPSTIEPRKAVLALR
jgi:hypothetical protein